MKHSAIIIMLAAVSVACSHHSKDKDDADRVMPVDVTEVITDSVTIYKSYPGTLSANRTVDVVAQVSGRLTGVMINGGEMVRKGQVLFTLDPTLYANAVQEAQAALSQATADYSYAEEHYNAVSRALQSNAVSKMEVSQARSARDQALSSIHNAQAALSTARTRLGYCRVTAPVSGHVSINTLSRGSYIDGEASPVTLATIYDDAVCLANFSIGDKSFEQMFLSPDATSEVDFTKVPVKFSQTLPHSYTANLSYIAPSVDPSTGTINMQGTVDNPYGELKSGMYLTISLPYKVEKDAMLVLDAAISTDQSGKYMYVVDDSSRVRSVPVTVGDLVNDSLRVVSSGLKPGDRYVTQALLKVRDGMSVKPVLRPAPSRQSATSASAVKK